VSDGRNAEPARLHDLLLQPGQGEHARGRRDRTGAEHPGELPNAVLDQVVERRHLGAELVLHRRKPVGPVAGRPDPHAAELSQLLGQRHPAQQIGDTLRDRPGRVTPVLGRSLVPGTTGAVMSAPGRALRSTPG